MDKEFVKTASFYNTCENKWTNCSNGGVIYEKPWRKRTMLYLTSKIEKKVYGVNNIPASLMPIVC